MCTSFGHMTLLVTPETPSFLHVLFAFFIRKFFEGKKGGGIDIHSIGVLCFGAIVSNVLGGSQASGSWSDVEKLEVLGFCSGGLLPVCHVLGNCFPH